MKNIYVMFVLLLIAMSTNGNAQIFDTIVGFTFPDGSNDNMVDISSASNASCILKTEAPGRWMSFNPPGVIGDPDKCAQTVDWNNGAWSKYWLLEFSTFGYFSLHLSSSQRSCGNHYGPRDFIVQYKLFNDTGWTDVPGGIVTSSTDWAAGSLTNLALPAICANQSQPVSLRWISTSEFDIHGNVLLSTGRSRIDNIFITGRSATSSIDEEEDSFVSVFPNPAHDNFTLYMGHDQVLKDAFMQIYSTDGRLCMQRNITNGNNMIDISALASGLYLVKTHQGGKEWATRLIKY
ncbi:MAG: T9SS type A sorting domain-containing protein [Candidatus Competibacteraceae bacterium]|nr:T9SS type A sorting domain-containing protein [Candidatus Competibacteraceae bacterium]